MITEQQMSARTPEILEGTTSAAECKPNSERPKERKMSRCDFRDLDESGLVPKSATQ